MKKISNHGASKTAIFVLVIVFVITSIGCAMFGGKKVSGPELGPVSDLQAILNTFPPITMAGKLVKINFGGDNWQATTDGKLFLAGLFASEDEEGRTIISLTQTHIYSDKQNPVTKKDVGWVPTPGDAITFLEYRPGPPATLLPKSD